MQHEITCRPSFSLLEVTLERGEKIVAEAGAMAWTEGPVKTETSTRGGVLQGLKRSVLSGESFFQNTYSAEGGQGKLGLAPGSAGDIIPYELSGNELLLERGAYLASTPGVQCDSKWQGLKGLFNEGLFVLRVTGEGLLFFNGYGDIQEIQVDGQYTVDNGYAVAWEPTLQYKLTRARKIRSFLFSDQLLLGFSGRGRIWVQSRSPVSLANWVYPFRPVKSND
jgi:uncharacterized protein (TIGR00266 family)